MTNKKKEQTETTIIWEMREKKETKGNLIAFPLKKEAIYQEKMIGQPDGEVKIRIVSSGFGIKSQLATQKMLAA